MNSSSLQVLPPPSQKLSINWSQLTVKVNQWTSKKSWFSLEKSKKVILDSLGGHFTPGTLNGLLGPSGAGKTTLLNVLSGSSSNYTGSLQFDCAQNQHSSTYYIRQHVADCIVLELTVGQLLSYAYAFKNDVIRVKKDAKEHIQKTLFNLSLPGDLLDRQLKKCSGGELKRVAIAQELMSLAPPTFLFLDEPTTGLDSVSAFEVMSCLKRLIKDGLSQMTIIASIHAPNDETLQLFDKLYVLAKGGVAVYEGPPDGIRMTLEMVTRVKVPKEQPPIEVLLKVACSGISDKNVGKLVKHCKSVKEDQQLAENENISITSQSKTDLSSFEGLQSRKTFQITNFLTHFTRQLRITFLAQLPSLCFPPLFLLCFFALLCTVFDGSMTSSSACYSLETNITSYADGSCKLGEDRLKEEKMFRENTMYFSYVFIAVFFIVMLTSTVLYRRTLTVFEAEHRNRWYSLGVYITSTFLVSLLEITLTSCTIAAFSYVVSGQHTIDFVDGFDPLQFNWARFGLYILFILLWGVYGQALGHLLGAIFVDWPIVAMISAELVTVSSSLFNGFYLNLDRMGNQVMVALEEMIALSGLSKGLLYSIYGFQRCDFDYQYSWVLVEYSVDREKVVEYVWRVLINVALIKIATIIALWWRFSAKPQKKRNEKDFEEKIKADKQIIENSFAKIEMPDVTKTSKSKGLRGSYNPSIAPSDASSLREEQREYRLSFSKAKIQLAWSNLSLFPSNSSLLDNVLVQPTHNQNNQQKPILFNLHGAIRFNSLTALMGTSGAGKTSLLKVLNGQCKTRLSADAQFNLSTLTAINTCFISQEVGGHLLHGLTAFQMLRYASMLRNTGASDYDDELLGIEPEVFNHDSIAYRWLNELGLEDAAHTRVENLSGGEAKRLAVAIELTADSMPNLVCIDEPTSGLDSNSAETVVKALRRLTDVHPLLTIVTSIHQPTAEVLALYDTLYVLARGGVCIYSGLPAQIQATLDGVVQGPWSGQKSPFPIENLIKQSCLGAEDSTNQALAGLVKEQFESVAFRVEIAEQTALVADGIKANRARFMGVSVFILFSRYLTYIRNHLWKEWLFFAVCSTIFGASLRFLFSPEVATYSGCLILEDDLSACAPKTEKDLQKEFALKDNLVYGNFFLAFYMMLVLLNSSRAFFTDYELFANEHRNGAFSTGAWYLVKSIIEVAPLVPCILVFVAIIDIYEPVVGADYTLGPVYFHIVLLMVLGVLVMTSLSHIISLLADGKLPVQTVLFVVLFLLSQLLCNYIIQVADMHYLWRGVATFSVLRYLFESLLVLQYGFGRCQPRVQVQAVLWSMSIADEDSRSVYVLNLVLLVANCVLFRLLALWLLVKRANPIDGRRERVERLEEFRKKLEEAVLVDKK